MKWNKLLAAALCGVLLTGCAPQAVSDDAGSAADQPESANLVVNEIAVSEFAVFGGCAALELPGRMVAAAATGSRYDETARFTAFSGSSEQTWQKLLDGELEVALAYAPSDAQREQLEEQGVLLQPVGADALVFLAGTDAADIALNFSKQDLLRIYQQGDATWKGYAAAPKSDARLLFSDWMGTDCAGVTLDENGETLTAACPHTTGTLCYTTYLSLQQTGLPENTQIVAVDGIVPSAQTLHEPRVSAEGYPIQITYYAACRAGLDENDPAMLLYRWLTSEDGMHWLHQNALADMEQEAATEDGD